MSSSLSAPAQLKTESQTNPLGLTERVPRFSWRIGDARPAAVQSAYRLIVGTQPKASDLWDSGQVAGDQTHFVPYGGRELHSRQRAYWQVQSFDRDGQASPWSEPAFFELGLIERQQWQARWIASGIVGGPQTSPAVPCLRKGFVLAGQVARARLYVTALGLHECFINGRKVTDDVFAPGWTDYSIRVHVQSYDVTSLLKPGDNAIGAMLGDGWYCGHLAWHSRQTWGDRPKLMAQLEVEYEDRRRQTIVTDDSWKTTSGAILSSDFLMGEQVDARLEPGRWTEAGYDDSAWSAVCCPQVPDIRLHASPAPMIRAIETLSPVSIRQVSMQKGLGTYLVDFGQNLVGRVRLAMAASAGQTVTLRFAEMLTRGDQGDLYTENYRQARCTDHYTCRGSTADAPEVFEPVFTFRGFRHVQVENYPGELKPEHLQAVVLHTPMEPAGTFECSHPLLNRLYRNILWGQRGNFLDVPTDCPQRNERLGWTGDAQVFVRTASLNFDVGAFFAKWLTDLFDTQRSDGAIPDLAPRPYDPMDGGPAWADAAVICPWTMWLAYADQRLIEKTYPAMQRFMEFLEKGNSKDGIRCHSDLNAYCYGDWLNLDGPHDGPLFGAPWGTPHDLIGTAYHAYNARLMSQMAQAIGKHEDARRYQALLQRVREAFVRRFVTADGLVASHTQTAYVLALHFGLLPEELVPQAVHHLTENIRKRNDHLCTGFVGTPYILFALSEHGRSDVAMKLLLQTTYPSWLYPVTNGATTIWERWDGWTHARGFQNPSMNSFNHYAYGAVGHWMITRLLGIDLDEQRPAGRHFILKPALEGQQPLDWARGSLTTPAGTLSLSWRRSENQPNVFELEIDVPANSSATLLLPGCDRRELAAGKHRCSCSCVAAAG